MLMKSGASLDQKYLDKQAEVQFGNCECCASKIFDELDGREVLQPLVEYPGMGMG